MSKIIWSGRYIDIPPMPGRIDIDMAFLQDYVEVVKIDDEIRKINKEKDNYILFAKSPKTIVQIREEVEQCIKSDIALTEQNLKRDVAMLQTGETGGMQIVTSNLVDWLNRLVSYKKLLKEVYLIPSTDVKGISEEVRASKIKECDDEIKKLNEKKGKFFYRGQTQWYSEISKKVERWIAVVVMCGECVDINGVWLDEKNEKDKMWLKIYHDLKFDEMPKHKLRTPMIKDGKEFEYFPGFYYKEK